MEQEIWKDIEWYEWLYQVSNLGRVKRLEKVINNQRWLFILEEQILKGSMSLWYKRVTLSKNLIKKDYKIHRLIAQAFIPNPDNKPFINHKNWIRNDNTIDNLEWCTPKENVNHSYKVLLNKSPMYGRKWALSHISIKRNQYDLEWNFIKTWDSWADIQRELWIHRGDISKCCKWKLKTAWGFIWKYLQNT